MKRALLAVLLLAACKKTPATCRELGPAIQAWGTDEVATDKLTGDAAAKRQALFSMTADLYPRVCESGKWSGETIDCLIAAKTEQDAQHCPLTRDQREDLQKALMDAIAGDKGAGSGSGSGSASGSAKAP
jgi:hypothetical protein